jgi:hypothetical protein
MHQRENRMNPSASIDLTSSDVDVSQFIDLLEKEDEETLKLKAAEKERQEKAKKAADQVKAKNAADSLTKQLIKHASNIRDGNPTRFASGKVPAKLKNAVSTSLAVRSLPLSPPTQTVNNLCTILTILLPCHRRSSNARSRWRPRRPSSS